MAFTLNQIFDYLTFTLQFCKSLFLKIEKLILFIKCLHRLICCFSGYAYFQYQQHTVLRMERRITPMVKEDVIKKIESITHPKVRNIVRVCVEQGCRFKPHPSNPN